MKLKQATQVGPSGSEENRQVTIMGYIENHNRDPRPIAWTAAADSILEKVGHAQETLDKPATV